MDNYVYWGSVAAQRVSSCTISPTPYEKKPAHSAHSSNCRLTHLAFSTLERIGTLGSLVTTFRVLRLFCPCPLALSAAVQPILGRKSTSPCGPDRLRRNAILPNNGMRASEVCFVGSPAPQRYSPVTGGTLSGCRNASRAIAPVSVSSGCPTSQDDPRSSWRDVG